MGPREKMFGSGQNGNSEKEVRDTHWNNTSDIMVGDIDNIINHNIINI